MARFPVDEFVAEQFRLTVFFAPGTTNTTVRDRLPEWWQAAVGSPPDESTTNPKLGTGSASGIYDESKVTKLTIKLEMDRIDWLMVGSESSLGIQPGPPTIGPALDALNIFSKIAGGWLSRDDIPDIVRVAFGGVLIHVETDRNTGYERLSEYLPVRLPPDASDFLFQINRRAPTKTGIEGLQINRLTRWSISRYMALRFKVTKQTVEPQNTGESVFAFRIELDINTTAEFTDLIPRAKLLDVYNELVELGVGVVSEGIGQQ